MQDSDRRAFLARARTAEYRRAVDEARRAIRAVVGPGGGGGGGGGGKAYVAYSGGKDSTAMLDMVMRESPGTPAMIYDFGEKMPRPYWRESLRHGRAIIARRGGGGGGLRVLGRSKHMTADLFGIHFPRLVGEGYTAAFVGLRRAESLGRRRRVDAGESLYRGLQECWPLATWTVDDVWGYIVSEGLPYHSHYDRYSQAQDIRDVRLSTFFDGHFAHLGNPNVDAFFSWRYAYKG